jgi:hypothetical protein
MTNADKFRSQTDEELAEYLCGDCPPEKCRATCSAFLTCQECWLDYLRQEADEECMT